MPIPPPPPKGIAFAAQLPRAAARAWSHKFALGRINVLVGVEARCRSRCRRSWSRSSSNNNNGDWLRERRQNRGDGEGRQPWGACAWSAPKIQLPSRRQAPCNTPRPPAEGRIDPCSRRYSRGLAVIRSVLSSSSATPTAAAAAAAAAAASAGGRFEPLERVRSLVSA
jgi:hypothetical protein